MIADEALAAKVKTELGVRDLKEKGEIKVRSENGTITLLGEVDNLDTKKAAEDAALSVMEVLGVDNQLDVKEL